MTETQLFYLTIMIALLILYLIVCKICDAKETKYKAIAMSSMKTIDLSEDEELKQKIIETLSKPTNKPGGDQ